ncbi:MAG: hypothetical protein KGL90_12370 [Burkholderiales bacterium]|nr:hypothetical protein [Burkholderiales bacterium]
MSLAFHPTRLRFGKKLTTCLSIVALQINMLTPTWAALSQTPLLASNGIAPKPNVILTLDNSESMSLNHMPEELAGTQIVRMHPDDDLSIASHTLLKSVAGYVPATGNCSNNIFECKMRSSGVNTIYYNPAVFYKPWINPNNPSARLADSAFTAAPVDPNASASTIINLSTTGAKLAKWCTSDSECNSSSKKFNPGIFYILKTPTPSDQVTDYTLVDLNSGTGPTYGRTLYPQRTDCPETGNCTLATEQQNFANWFTYYRARILFTKAALSEAFASQGNTLRLGWGFTQFATSSNTVDSVSITGGPIQGVRDFTDKYKTDFLKAIQTTQLQGSTPLRYAMDGVGQYFQRTDTQSPWRDNPESTSSGKTLSCRRAYNILTTDGYYNDDSLGSIYKGGKNNIENVDNQTVSSGNATHYTPTKPYADSANTLSLADIAMYYWANDLQSGIDNNVPTIPKNINIGDATYYDADKDPATWQHLTQFTVGVGVAGSLNPRTDLPALKSGALSWPKISSNASRIDDLWHAAVNSRGQFYMVNDASSFKKAIKDAVGKTGNLDLREGGVALAGQTIQSASRKYVPTYNAFSDSPWTGDLAAYELDTKGNLVSKTPIWTVANQVPSAQVPSDQIPKNRVPSEQNRKLFVWNSSTGNAVPFQWDSMDASNKSLMPSGSSKLIDYVRGDTSNEGPDTGKFRERNGSKFADFIDSNPLYVKDHVNLKYGSLTNGGTSYSDFITNKGNRSPVIFIGGNGGFLHGFQDTDGTEVFGFVPRGVIGNLPKLAEQNYGRSNDGNEHQFYVDGPIVESDAYLNNGWRNVLVGALGAGGKGVYALDVSNLSGLSANSVMWDATLPTDNDVGSIVSAPQVGVLPDGSWKVFVGNGYDSTSGAAALLMYDMGTGSLSKLVLGNTSASPNGLGGVLLLRNAKQEVIGAYAGDLNGNLWRFEYSASAQAMVVGYGNSPLFVAKDSNNQRQPITAAPAIVSHPSGGNVLVFGTGKLLEATDKTSSANRQSLYGVWDKNGLDVVTSGLTPPFAVADGSNPRVGKLIEQTATPAAIAGTFDVTSNPQNNKSLGWFLDLSIKDGQRLIYPVQTIGSYALFGTIVPSSAATQCTTATAEAYNFLLPARTGAQSSAPILDLNGDGFINSQDGNSSAYRTDADGTNTPLTGDGTSNGNGTPGPTPYECQIHNTTNKIDCVLPKEDPNKYTKIVDRVWKRLLNVPQPH